MKGSEFIRKLRALAKSKGLYFEIVSHRGKGSHQTIFLGEAFTIIPNLKKELSTGTLHAICSQLKIKPNDL
jgi:mRNA interferase HicA